MAMRMMGVAEAHEAKCVGGQAAKDCPNKAHPGPGQLSQPYGGICSPNTRTVVQHFTPNIISLLDTREPDVQKTLHHPSMR